MAIKKSTTFLPEIHKTRLNKKFLAATLDQLISDSSLKKVNGYIGNNFGSRHIDPTSFIDEATTDRKNYQLEPSLVVKDSDKNITKVVTYPEVVDKLGVLGANITREDRLFEHQEYTLGGIVDLDKAVNFSQYYWLPNGPDAVDIFSSAVPQTDVFEVERTANGYVINGQAVTNPKVTVMRGGSYTFRVNQPGTGFWLQTEEGTSGVRDTQANISTRDIKGVVNNGDDVGDIIFNVPGESSQDQFIRMTVTDHINLVTTLNFDDIHNRDYDAFIAEFGGIDGTEVLDDKKIIFFQTDLNNWYSNSLFEQARYDLDQFAAADPIAEEDRYDVWKINIDNNNIIKLSRVTDWPVNTKVLVGEGNTYGNKEIWKTASGELALVPLITAPNTTLYYQDATNSDFFGQISVILADTTPQIDVEADILGKTNYISPNGVEFTNGLKVSFDQDVVQAEYRDREYYVEGVGKSITLTPVDELVTPETWTNSLSEGYDTTLYDVGSFESTFNSPVDKDYIVINRASLDRNAWSRHNRWFHIDVINKTAEYNNYTPVINQNDRAKRPIIEFVANIQLFDQGRISKGFVDIIDFNTTDAFSIVEGSAGYFVDGVELVDGTRIIFVNDSNPDIAGKIYTVSIIDPDNDGNGQIHLSLASDAMPLANDNIIVTKGLTYQGNSFYFNGTTWVQGQYKTGANVEPLFDAVDANGYSLADELIYQSSSFAGTKIFGYKQGSGANDSELGFPLSYATFNNVGDIEFESFIDTDTFTYITQGESVTENVTVGNLYKYTNRNTVVKDFVWQKNYTTTNQFQIINILLEQDLDGIAIPQVESSLYITTLFVYADNELVTDYTTTIVDGKTNIDFTTPIGKGKNLVIRFLSNTKDTRSYYEIANNLALNANNKKLTTFTLGQVRNHLGTITENNPNFVGSFPGSSNLRDIGDYAKSGGDISQHESSFLAPALFLTDDHFDVIKSLRYAQKEYAKFKSKFVDTALRLDLNFDDIPGCVDDILTELNSHKSASEFPFYYSDMIGYTSDKIVTTYTVIDDTQNEWEISEEYNKTVKSYRSVIVYLNNTQLLESSDYTFVDGRPAISISVDLNTNDIIKIVEYNNTRGSYIPATPTKLGLWYKFKPEKYTDSSYINPVELIRGHDGSITVAYGDSLDDVILELEKRIYNNIKTSYNSDRFDWTDLMPGAYRSNSYTKSEIDDILSTEYYTWASKNAVVIPQSRTEFSSNDPFTWNYSTFDNVVNGELLDGNWRGVYKYFYDCETPNLTPWEMLGFTEMPTWWVELYGPAPYTSGNDILWSDLEQGKVYNSTTGTYTVDSLRVRPGLTDIIPVDEFGELLPPLSVLVKTYDSLDANEPYEFGDDSPQENAWRKSSDFPYSMCVLACLTKPGKFLDLHYDIDAIVERNGQYIDTTTNIRHQFTDHKIHNSDYYINGFGQYISDYNVYVGVSTSTLEDKIANVDVNLAYRMGGYSDLNKLKIVATQVTPTSQNESVFIPDENATLMLHKGQSIAEFSYSGIIVEKTGTGYTVSGYDLTRPYFEIIPSVVTGNRYAITAGSATSVVYKDYAQRVVQIPYGTEFKNRDQLVDFLVSHERFLVSQGFVFDEPVSDSGITRDFVLSAKEFLFWTTQNWAVNSIIVLNPAGKVIKFNRSFEIVDNLLETGVVLDNNLKPIRTDEYEVYREDNTFELRTERSIGVLTFTTVQYEHVLVLDNTTIFNDIVYQPELGNRQQAIKLNGYISQDWNGSLYAPGFILNQDNVAEWVPGKNYAKGDFVTYKGKTYVSQAGQEGSDTFNFNLWGVSDAIPTGLLPNWSAKSSQFEKFYDIDFANFEEDADTFGKGLIGYQKRDYLENLQLEDVSQVKFYQGMIAEKGTANSINNLLKTEIDNLTVDLTFFEEWAVRSGSYGAVDINQVLELKLQEGLINSSPTIVELVETGSTTEQDRYQITPDQVWKKPNNYTTSVFGTRALDSIRETDIRTAGYASLEDVDTTLWNISDLKDLNSLTGQMEPGYTIWVAKSDNDDWNIYRVTSTRETVTRAQVNTNSNIIFTLDQNTDLVIGDYILIRNFQEDLNGFHKVIGRAGTKQVIVDTQGSSVDFTGLGTVLKLTSTRFATPSSASNFTDIIDWRNGETFWADDTLNAGWKVYEKSSPWNFGNRLLSSVPGQDYNLGSSVSISADNNFIVSGQPGANQAVGYFRTESGFTQSGIIAPVIDDLSQFGFSISAGDNNYYAIGAPASNNSAGYVIIVYRDAGGNFTPVQVLVDPSQTPAAEFGYAVEMSHDESWLYVGAPGEDEVYAFAKIVPESDGSTSQSNTIFGDGSTKSFTLDRTFDTIWEFSVTDDNGKLLRPYIDYTLTGNDTIVFATAPASVVPYVIRQQTHYSFAGTFTATDVQSGDRFGASVHTTTDGSKIVIGAPYSDILAQDSTLKQDAGCVYVFERSVEEYVADGTTTTYNTNQSINTLISTVKLNNVATTDVSVGSTSITFATAPALGVDIAIENNQFNQIQKLNKDQPNDFDLFGFSSIICFNDCSLYIGAPGADGNDLNSGVVYRYTNVAKLYGSISGTVDSTQVNIGDVLKVNNRPVVLTGTTAESIAQDITNENIPGVTASASNSTLSISSIDQLFVLGVTPGLLDALGFEVADLVQTISHPDEESNERFGYSLSINRDSDTLFVGSPFATTYKFCSFDNSTTTYDSETTRFVDAEVDSGSVYVFEYLSGAEQSINDPGAFIPVQQLVATEVTPTDEFGFSVSATNTSVLVGAPKDENTVANSGSVYFFENADASKGWSVLREQPQAVDIDLINSIKLYNTVDYEVLERLDFIDPVKGKIAGEAKQNIDIIGDADPAIYNTGDTANNNDYIAWCGPRRGTIWWDTSTVRFLEYEQSTLETRAKYWNQTFPGSSIDVYEFIGSTLPPLQYIQQNAEQSLKYPNGDVYTVDSQYDETSNTFRITYFFWVKGKPTISNYRGKTLSVSEISQYIESPRSLGFPYIAFLDSNAIALYNVNDYLEDYNVAVSINYDVQKNEQNLHTEFELVKQGSGASVISDRLFRKVKDSLAGTTLTGETVPARNLNANERLGIEFRPRQTMVDNRETALQEIVNFVNAELVKESYAGVISYTNLNSEEEAPTQSSGAWNRSISTDAELEYIDADELPTGYKILVVNDTNEDGLWTIRTLNADKEWAVSRVQSYKTSNYWSTEDWYADGYSATTTVTHIIPTINEVVDLTLAVGDIVKVENNVSSNFELYEYTTTGLELVGLGNGTIQLSTALYDNTVENTGFDNEVFGLSRFDQQPTIETHKILDAVKEDIFIAEKAVLFNDLTFNFFEYILHEQQYVDWLFKTSFISLEHKIRGLDQYATYQPDNQTFLIDYINEAKPYHTKIREYLYKYDKTEQYLGDVTDFDVASFYDETLGIYRKPESTNNLDASKFQESANISWYNNHDYSVGSIVVSSGGSGYTTAPVVTISAPEQVGGVTATATASIRNGAVYKITVTNAGSGYITTPTITLTGGNGTGAKAAPRMENYQTRKVATTIKFDRFRYTSDIVDWTANTSYATSDIISYNGEAYTVTQNFTSGSAFNAENLSVVPDADFDNANDRIMGYYNPTAGMLGKDLTQLVYGIEYPGVFVNGPGFNLEPGYDVAAFDIEGFDNFEISPEGIAVLSEGVLDTKIESSFTDSTLGLRPQDINIDGSDFVNEYSSHAPEELVPGRVYDTLDLKVFQTPTSNSNNDGNGINIIVTYIAGDGSSLVHEIAEGDMVVVYTKMLGARYKDTHYTVNYASSTITFNTPLADDDIAYVYVFRVAGENNVAEVEYIGDGSTSAFNVQISPEQALQAFAMVEGDRVDVTIVDTGDNINVVFPIAPNAGDRVKIWIFNTEETLPYSEIYEQVIPVDGSTLVYELDRDVVFTGPASGNMILEYNGNRLRPANSVYYVADASTLTYDIPTSANDIQTGISDADIGVWVNDIKQELYIDYVISIDDGSSTRTVTFISAPTAGSDITVSIGSEAEYRIENDNLIVLSDSIDISQGGNLRAITFSNHDDNDIQTKIFIGTTESTITTEVGFGGGPYDAIGFEGTSITVISNPIYELDRNIENSNYIWVTVDGIKLHPGIDYSISNNRVEISPTFGVADDSVVVITSFTEQTSVDMISWRIFQNMLGETEYHRMVVSGRTYLSQSLLPTDDTIYVEDGSKLSEPDLDKNIPGVIFIDGERITYWHKNGNVLTQIRRGTGGTGTPVEHPEGISVIDAGQNNIVQGTDTATNIWLDQGDSTAANGLGLQRAQTSQAKFLREQRGVLPLISNDQRGRYLTEGYVEEGYVEINL